MQPNNSLTDLNNKSVLVYYVYARLKGWVFNEHELRWRHVRMQRLLRVPKTVFMSVSLVSSSSNCLTLSLNHKVNTSTITRAFWKCVYKHKLSPVTTEKLQGLCLLLKPNPETAASPTDATRTKRRCRRCERGTEARQAWRYTNWAKG